MHLKKNFITHEVEDIQVMVQVGGSGFHGIVRSNQTAAFIVDQLKEDTDEEHVVEALRETYDVDQITAKEDVHKVIEELKSIGALE